MDSNNSDWWGLGIPCEEDGISFCARCKVYSGFPKYVFVTRGWSNAFHKSNDCKGLADGQAIVERRGGTPAEVIQVTIAEGHRHHEPCLICFPR